MSEQRDKKERRGGLLGRLPTPKLPGRGDDSGGSSGGSSAPGQGAPQRGATQQGGSRPGGSPPARPQSGGQQRSGGGGLGSRLGIGGGQSGGRSGGGQSSGRSGSGGGQSGGGGLLGGRLGFGGSRGSGGSQQSGSSRPGSQQGSSSRPGGGSAQGSRPGGQQQSGSRFGGGSQQGGSRPAGGSTPGGSRPGGGQQQSGSRFGGGNLPGRPPGGAQQGSKPGGGSQPGGSRPGGSTPGGGQQQSGSRFGGGSQQGGSRPGGSTPGGGQQQSGSRFGSGSQQSGDQPAGGSTPGGSRPGGSNLPGRPPGGAQQGSRPGGTSPPGGSRPSGGAQQSGSLPGGSTPSGSRPGGSSLPGRAPGGGQQSSRPGGSSPAGGSRPGGGSQQSSRPGGSSPSGQQQQSSSRLGSSSKLPPPPGGRQTSGSSQATSGGQQRKRATTTAARTKSRSAAKGKRKKKQAISLTLDTRLDIIGIALVVAALITVLSFLSKDPGQFTGWWLTVIRQLFGWGAFVVPIALGAIGVWLILRKFEDMLPDIEPLRLVGGGLAFAALLTGLHFFLLIFKPDCPASPEITVLSYRIANCGHGGGYVGAFVYQNLHNWIGGGGVFVTFVAVGLVGSMLAAELSAQEAVELGVNAYQSLRKRGPATAFVRTKSGRMVQVQSEGEAEEAKDKDKAKEAEDSKKPAAPKTAPATAQAQAADGKKAEDGKPKEAETAKPGPAKLPGIDKPAPAPAAAAAAGATAQAAKTVAASGLSATTAAPPASRPAPARPAPSRPSPSRPTPGTPGGRPETPDISGSSETPEKPSATPGRPMPGPQGRERPAPDRPARPVPKPGPIATEAEARRDGEDEPKPMVPPPPRPTTPPPRPSAAGGPAITSSPRSGAPPSQPKDVEAEKQSEPDDGVKLPVAQAAAPTAPPRPAMPRPQDGEEARKPEAAPAPAAEAKAAPAPAPAPAPSPPSTPTGTDGGEEFPDEFSPPPPTSTMGQKFALPDFREMLEPGVEKALSDDELRRRAEIIENTLASFGAPGRVVEVNQGPVITQFGVEPDYIESRAGKRTKVKVGKISALADDVALALAAPTIRIEAPVPGKGYVGVEVPNPEPSLVSLREIMDSDNWNKIDSQLKIGLGQDVSGQAVAADLTAMPHLLIAGTTGSGKSVCVNGIISALLLTRTPDELKLIMVDPKRVELTNYNGIPHLMAPVVTELERIVGVLKWVQREMDERYRRFAMAGARNIADYNRRATKQGEDAMYYIVVIVDELADLMMLAPDETERLITRLAQMARATGIHLIISTQRPSVDVVTGLIKANFPSRIAFAVPTGVDSRVILDMPGAERLLGRGDMLFQAPDAAMPLRLQGTYVADQEIDEIVDFWRNQGGPTPTPIAESKGGAHKPAAKKDSDAPAPPAPATAVQRPLFIDEDEDAGSDDALYDEAVELAHEMGKISISLLQRRLRIGYTRAARLIDEMEENNIIGPHEGGSKPRKVLGLEDESEDSDDEDEGDDADEEEADKESENDEKK